VIWRMGRPPDFKDPEQRKRLADLARRAIEKHGKAHVINKLHVNQTTLDRWASGKVGVSAANARELAKLVDTTLERVLGSNPDRQAETPGLRGSVEQFATLGSVASRTGVDVGLAALRERAHQGHVFPNLAFFLELNDRRRPDRKKDWALSTIVAAAAGMAGDEDHDPEAWELILDRIEELGEQVRSFSGMHASARPLPPPSSRPKLPRIP
jgi:hypothetical protein